MKKKIISTRLLASLLSMATLSFAILSCNKENSASASGDDLTTVTQATITSLQAIAVASDGSADSIYVIGTCAKGHRTDSVAFSALPSSISAYLTENYSGYTFAKAYSDKDGTGTVSGYVIIIKYNGKPVGLKFDASGTFVQVLEQREGHDLRGHGWHNGGLFDDRDGLKRDTVALNSLPAAITAYFTANYAQDTLVHAFKNKSGGYVVLSINAGVFATVFDSNGSFIRRVSPAPRPGRAASITEAALPAQVQSYLATTYPNYVFKHAFAVKPGGTIQAYVVIIDASGTKYAVEFDATGSFIKAITIV